MKENSSKKRKKDGINKLKDMAPGVIIINYIRYLFPWRSCSNKTMKKM